MIKALESHRFQGSDCRQSGHHILSMMVTFLLYNSPGGSRATFSGKDPHRPEGFIKRPGFREKHLEKRRKIKHFCLFHGIINPSNQGGIIL